MRFDTKLAGIKTNFPLRLIRIAMNLLRSAKSLSEMMTK